LIFALSEHPDGVETEPGLHVVYDVSEEQVALGEARIGGPAVVWDLVDDTSLVTQCHKARVALVKEVELESVDDWILRCDRVDFPPRSVAYRHVHPGPGIRRILFGALTIDRGDRERRTYRAGESWYEGADDPVLATASPAEDTAFVRVLLLPAEWAGKRTIRYLDPADEDKPRLQRATVLLEEPLRL
jgi:quercetin dioxygenase-like cupin family protein